MLQYADRMFMSVNGSPIIDLQSVSAKVNRNAKAVGTMTPDRWNKGFVEGNSDIDITATIAVQGDNGKQRPKLDYIDYKANDVSITLVFGQEQLVFSPVFIKDASDDSPNIGEEVKTTFTFGALKVVNGSGAEALFDAIEATL